MIPNKKFQTSIGLAFLVMVALVGSAGLAGSGGRIG